MNWTQPFVGTAAVSAMALAVLGQVRVLPAPPMPTAPPASPVDALPPPPSIPADQLKGKLISLNLRDIPIRAALQQLGDAAGMQFNLGYRDWAGNVQPDKRVSLEVHDKPLWETMLALLKQADLDVPLNMTMGVPGSGNYTVAGRAFASGPFLVVARNITHDQPVQPGAVPGGGRGPAGLQSPVRLEVYVVVDPSLRLSRLDSQVVPKRATDDKGNSLVPQMSMTTGGSAGYFGSQGGFTVYNAAVTLQYPALDVQAGQKITVVEGTIQASVSDTQSVEIAKGEKLEKQFGAGGGIKLTVQWGPPADLPPAPGFRPGAPDSPFAAVVRVESDPNLVSPPEFSAWNPGALQMKLLDAAGNAMRANISSSSSSPNSRQMTYRFNSIPVADGRGGVATPGEPIKAIVEVPISIKSVDIPFRFENIPLP